jgi:hypothetical protein
MPERVFDGRSGANNETNSEAKEMLINASMRPTATTFRVICLTELGRISCRELVKDGFYTTNCTHVTKRKKKKKKKADDVSEENKALWKEYPTAQKGSWHTSKFIRESSTRPSSGKGLHVP